MARAARPRDLWLAAAVAFLAALPFVGKAVQQDDWAYLATAPGMIAEPGEWLAQTTIYQGEEITAAEGVLHGPVWLTCLAIGMELGGGDPVLVPHLFMALFLALLAAATTSLAARFGAPPLATGLALALSPAILVMAGSVMTDLPMVALFAAAIALFARGYARGSWLELVLAGLVGLAASLTRYHGAAIVPLFLVAPLGLGGEGPVRKRGFLPAAVAALGFAIFAWMTKGDWERAVGMLGEIPAIDYRACLLAAVIGLGGCGVGWAAGVLAAPLWSLQALRRRPGRIAVLALGALLAGGLGVLAWDRPPDRVATGIDAGLQVAALLTGAVVIVGALASFVPLLRAPRALRTWREEHGVSAFLATWLLGFLVAAWVTVPFGATRYALPAMTPFFLLAGRWFGTALPARSAWVAAAVSGVVGLLAATADLRSAEVHRDFAARVAAAREEGDPASPFVGEEPGGELWVWGELGFRYYLERTAGARILPSDSDEPAAGDLILKSSVCTATPDDGRTGLYAIDPRLYQRLSSRHLEEAQDAYPVRVHNTGASAGFYHADAGYLPFGFSTAPHDRLQVWAVASPNPVFERVLAGEVEVTDGLRVDVARFRVHPEEEMRMAVTLLGEGTLELTEVLVPAAGSELVLGFGESWRVWSEDAPGRGVRLRVGANDVVLFDETVLAREREEDRRWFELRRTLPFDAGTRVALWFEVEALAAEGVESEVAFTALADPRIVTPR